MTFTGDAFVDLGGLVINTLPHKTIEDKIRFATDVYVDQWKGKLHSIFLNSKITHISAKSSVQKRQNSLKYYYGLLNNDGAAINEGYCRVCARPGYLFEAGRDTYPLTGSGEFVNFHHFHDGGLLVCKECLIKIYFIPLGILACGEKLMALQVQDKYTFKFWQEEVIQRNLDKIHVGSSDGILKSNLSNPQNGLFHIASKMISRFDDEPSLPVRLYYFSNFGSSPDVAIYDLPNSIYVFLKRVLKTDLENDWKYLVKRHFRLKKAHFDEERQEWLETRKNEEIKLDIQNYGGWSYNFVYDYLLSGKSLLGILRKIHKIKPFPIMIAITYLKEVRRMRQEQIDLICRIADKIIILSQKGNNYNKFLIPLEGARYAGQLRTVILRLVKAHYKNGEAEPFIRFKEYVEFLFPDGQNWMEVRDFLLISLFERLHDLRIEADLIADEGIPDIDETVDYVIDRFNA